MGFAYHHGNDRDQNTLGKLAVIIYNYYYIIFSDITLSFSQKRNKTNVRTTEISCICTGILRRLLPHPFYEI